MTDWKTYKLGEVSSDISYGYTESAKQEKIGPKFLRITDIQNDHVDWYNVPYCKITPKDFEKYKLQIGDIVIARTGNSTGATSTIKDDVEAVYASYLVRYRLDQKIANPFFVDYILRSNKWKLFVDSIKGGSAQPGANAKQLAEFEFNLPDLPTQRRIAEILSALDDKIELNHRMNKTLEQMAHTLFRQYFVDGIDEENLPEVWKLGKLGDVSKNVRKTVNPKELQEECKYIGLEHIPRKSIALTDWSTSVGVESQKYKFGQNHILFGKLRPYFHKVILAPFEGICSTDILVIEPLKDYMLAFCLLHYSSEEVVQYSNQLSHGTRMPRADWKGLSGYEIAIPPTDLLNKFNDLATPSLQKIKANIEEIQTLTQLRDTLLPKFMSGEIDVMQIKPEELHEPVLS